MPRPCSKMVPLGFAACLILAQLLPLFGRRLNRVLRNTKDFGQHQGRSGAGMHQSCGAKMSMKSEATRYSGVWGHHHNDKRRSLSHAVVRHVTLSPGDQTQGRAAFA